MGSFHFADEKGAGPEGWDPSPTGTHTATCAMRPTTQGLPSLSRAGTDNTKQVILVPLHIPEHPPSSGLTVHPHLCWFGDLLPLVPWRQIMP